jgi:hypothetical protein
MMLRRQSPSVMEMQPPVDSEACQTNLDLQRTLTVPEEWHKPRSNIAKLLGTYWSFFLLGANDSAYGVRLDYISPMFSPKGNFNTNLDHR